MNVSELRQRIFDQMDYFPDLQQYRDSVVRRLNDRYLELCDSAHWLFLQKQIEFKIRGPITSTSSSSGLKVTVDVSNERKLTASGFTPTEEMLGQTLTNTDTSQEYTIVGINGTSIFLNADWTVSGDVFTFKIAFNRYLLPDDCIEILGIVDRDADRGRLLQIDRRREEFAYLDADQSGDPSVVVEDDHVLDDAPFNAPLASAGISGNPGNELQNDTEYEYKYTIFVEGRETPPSATVTVKTGLSGPASVVLKNLDNTGHFNNSIPTYLDSGIIKLIYRRDKTNNGRWRLISSVSSITTSFEDKELTPVSSFAYTNQASFKYQNNREIKHFVEAGPRQYVRFWFTADLDKDIHLRYHYRPATLVADTDSPVLPRQYHHLLVYMTLQEMFMQMQDTTQAQLFERRAQQLLVQLRRRYLTRDDVKKRFMRFDRPRRFKNVYGAPTISN